MRKHAGILLLFPFLLLAQEKTELIGAGMTLHGRIIRAPCTVNQGKAVDIHFGHVDVQKVNGDNYTRTFTFNYTCEGENPDKLLTFYGVSADFDQSAVQSSIANLAIRVRRIDGGNVQSVAPGSTLVIPASQTSTQFDATPVRKANTTLQAGDFAASMTFQLSYP